MPPFPLRLSPCTPALYRPLPAAPRLALPLFGCPVRAGFPSPATDYVSDHLDLNEHLIAHKEATFFVRAKGQSMLGAGIQDGDLLIVDRSLTPTPVGSVVVTEDRFEHLTLGCWLADVCQPELHGMDIAPDGSSPERAARR